jgi:predicted lipoprotein with Yx(FWY)xxD motif
MSTIGHRPPSEYAVLGELMGQNSEATTARMLSADRSFGQLMETTMAKLNNVVTPLAAAAFVFLLAACSQYDIFGTRRDIVIDQPGGMSFVSMQTTAGKVLAAPNGMTLYTYDKDTAGQPTCSDDCAQFWPPALGDSSSKPAGNMTLVARSDGKMQWAADGKPLYTFVQDKKPGEVKGENFHNVWHVVRLQ